MQVFPSYDQFQRDPTAAALLNCLQTNEQQLGLSDAMLYYAFPLYRDDEGGTIVADAVLLSSRHGVIVFAFTRESHTLSSKDLQRCVDVVDQFPSYIQSRLIKNKYLRKGPTRLAFDITPLIYAPLLPSRRLPDDLSVLNSDEALAASLDSIREATSPLGADTLNELISTIEGAKGLIRTKKRDLPTQDESSKGKQAELVDAAITLFDRQQKHGMMGRITGPQRIRGLAGSGKTVVLAMKAAQTHLQYPDAKIAYTFYTKSLYQHVKRLITRFYRQFDDQDPDFDHSIHVLHGWGGSGNPGIYSIACEQHKVPPLSVQEIHALGDKFDYACTALMKATEITPQYDFVFVDEGQDFPASFIQLCHSLAKQGKFVFAYDDLQTIFQAKTPTTAEIFGTNEDGSPKVTFEEDVVLHKCYRNPREVLVAAHALGFGVYGKRIVQMLESRDHWEDIGYVVKEGDFVEGSQITVERPKENSLEIISDLSGLDSIVQSHSHKGMEEEIRAVAKSIAADLADGIRPDDVLVVCVDDRHAKNYLSGVELSLHEHRIECNNLHSDSFGIRDFSKDGRVTLSTVHKAKGNEAFMVYVLGVDSVMSSPDVRRRNMLFTAMTRAKGWVRVSGVGDGAKQCMAELKQAKENFPTLVFKYPGPKELKIMKRDLAEAADKKLKLRRLIDQLREENLSEEEIEEILKETKRASGSRRRKPRKGISDDR